MEYIASFFAGAFLCNCIPHLACGLRGETFPTPFANPRGKGPSAPIVNFLWGAFNWLVGVYLLSRHPVTVDFEPGFLVLIVGALAIGVYLSSFRKVSAGQIRRLTPPSRFGFVSITLEHRYGNDFSSGQHGSSFRLHSPECCDSEWVFHRGTHKARTHSAHWGDPDRSIVHLRDVCGSSHNSASLDYDGGHL